MVDAEILRGCLDALADFTDALESPGLELARAFPRPRPSVHTTPPREDEKRWHNLNRPVFKVGGGALLAVLLMKCPADTAVTTWQQAKTSAFQQANGTITQVPESDGSGIRYSYVAAGREYSGTHISKLPVHDIFSLSLDQYVSGQHVFVYYAGADPQDSVLKRGLAPVAENIHIQVFMSVLFVLPMLMGLVHVTMVKPSVRQRAGLTLLRLPHLPPLFLGLEAMLCLMFAFGMMLFVVRGDWWPWNACLLWPGVAIGGCYSYWHQRKRERAGKFDMIVERSTILVPARIPPFEHPCTIVRAQVVGVGIDEEEAYMDDSYHTRYVATILHGEDGACNVRSFSDKEKAVRFAHWLATQLDMPVILDPAEFRSGQNIGRT